MDTLMSMLDLCLLHLSKQLFCAQAELQVDTKQCHKQASEKTCSDTNSIAPGLLGHPKGHTHIQKTKLYTSEGVWLEGPFV